MSEQQREHEDYEAMAVSHVLGGLRVSDASVFRLHLLECRDCRLRVAELRGIAADLAEAERDALLEEHGGQQDRRADDVARDEPFIVLSPAARRALLAFLLVSVLGLSYWNYHLRRVNAIQSEVLDVRGQVVEVLTMGELVPVTESGLKVTVGTGYGYVAMSAMDIPAMQRDERLIVWLLGPRDRVRAMSLSDAQLPDGTLLVHEPIEGATRLVVSIESFPLDDGQRAPTGDILAEADLSVAAAS